MIKILTTLILSFIIHIGMAAQTDSLPLWPDGVPGESANHGITEEWYLNQKGSFKNVRNVTVPMIYSFIPDSATEETPAVVICPGGGYGTVSITHEGFNLAEWFVEHGIAAFVVKYRLPDEDVFEDKSIVPLQDVQQAFKFVHYNAKRYNIDANKVGVMGFSAGGHLAATASVHFKKRLVIAKSKYLRPDFSILVYPVITFTDPYTHKGSRKNLIGPEWTEKEEKYYSCEKQVRPNTPVTFLIHAKNDKAVPWQNTDMYMKALNNQRVSNKVVYLEDGGHGFGYREGSKYNDWINHLEDWLKDLKLIN